MRKRSDVVRVRHGPWVETIADSGFFEGCWDGLFESGAFEQADFLAGSGGRVVDDGVLFASPSHPYEGLCSILTGDDDLWVSNSLVFLLVEAGRTLDVDHPGYFFDLLHHHRAGLSGAPKPIHVRDGAPVLLHGCCGLFVTSDLVLSRREKPQGAPPRVYADYIDGLERAVGRLCANASHPARIQAYRPVTTLSRGYDSTAVSVLAARAGCREAVTFRRSPAGGQYIDDSGAQVANGLGLAVTEYERLDFNHLDGLPDAEFFANPFAMTGAIAVMERQLEGALLMTGIWGDKVWSKDSALALPRFRMAVDVLYFGSTLTEFRLRTGFVHLPLACWHGLHAPSIRRITLHKEMAPWTVGGDYDRPIPRRIAEEGGVPRGLFGQAKAGGATLAGVSSLSPAAERDFLAFWRAVVGRGAASRVRRRGRVGAGQPQPMGASRPRQWWTRTARRLPWAPLRDRLDPRWGSKYLYVVHWGFERMRPRYEPDVSIVGGKTSPPP